MNSKLIETLAIRVVQGETLKRCNAAGVVHVRASRPDQFEVEEHYLPMSTGLRFFSTAEKAVQFYLQR